MRKGMFGKLAVQNIRNNRSTYVPYMLTCIFCIAMMYMMEFLRDCPTLEKAVPQAAEVRMIVGTGEVVVGIFCVIFLIYSNSFLMKHRQKEIGLYNILGLEKGHIGKVMFLETSMTSLLSLTAGIGIGILGSKLSLLLLFRFLHVPAVLGFYVSITGILFCIAGFGGIFLVILALNLTRVRMNNPIELLRGGNTGEKEPRAKWLMALLGMISLGVGYYLAVTTESPIQAIFIFLLAVILVMAGTYLLFTAGSIVILKLLRKNKKFYYKTGNFISVSGMIYRMKQNGAGLANICVLSTMVLVMVSTTVSLYAGMEDILDSRFPRDVSIVCNEADTNNEETLQRLIKEQCEKAGVKITDRVRYRYGSMNAVLKGNNLEKIEQYYPDNHFYYVEMITQEEYNRIEKQNVSLKEQEILTYTTNGKCGKKQINIAGQNYQVKKELSEMTSQPKSTAEMYKTLYIVFANAEQIERIESFSYADKFNLKGDDGKQKEALEQIQNEFYEKFPDGTMESRMLSRSSFYKLYGGLFFIGIYLGSMFIMATVLIIYYKQISEGYDDRERYQIMQKVGMSKKEVKRSIRSQVLSVFFLPLVVAVIHVAVAFKVMTKILGVLNFTNVSLFAVCTIITIAVFAVFYIIVYSITAKEYYRIVN